MPEIAENLRYSWDRRTRDLFGLLDPVLWSRMGHSPKLCMRHVSQDILDRVAEDSAYLTHYQSVLAAYDRYQDAEVNPLHPAFNKGDLVAYFCAEFGMHESLQIYSGGLGILAGDHCKTASDLNLPFVAVGLMYRRGYFRQSIDGQGRQIAENVESRLEDLPVAVATNAAGEEVKVYVEVRDRRVALKVWEVQVGRIRLFLLDSDLPENSEADRGITYQLYGGGRDTRIQQEIVLGVGGVRALDALGLKPNVWHLNEGHAAFASLERTRQHIDEGMPFDEALELTASNTVFTTHTPVPAGHDSFSRDMVLDYLRQMRGMVGLSDETFVNLGRWTPGHGEFNMTTLAMRGSRQQNGVSRIHGDVSSELCSAEWPEVPPEENPLGYVTNGTHVPSFLSIEWMQLFDSRIGQDWRNRLSEPVLWQQINDIQDHEFWDMKRAAKTRLLVKLRKTLTEQYSRNGMSEVRMQHALQWIDPGNPGVLLIGFARRFATYKRAGLLFADEERLRRLVSGDRPVVFVFAGKAHPADAPGQELIRMIHRMSQKPEFLGKILMVENYDLSLSRRLVAGCDVWLNTPIYPLEASGTSGMKAAINGTINLSVLDGWWAEGYDGTNGWGVVGADHADPDERDAEDRRAIFDLLEDQVLPLYYDWGTRAFSAGWVHMAKRSMITILPKFNMARTLTDYINDYYVPAREYWIRLEQGGRANVRTLAAWKRRVRDAWPGVAVWRMETCPSRITYGGMVNVEVAARLNGLSPEDVRVEMVVDALDDSGEEQSILFEAVGPLNDREVKFSAELAPSACGRVEYSIRIYPTHELLGHPMEMGMMRWVSN